MTSPESPLSGSLPAPVARDDLRVPAVTSAPLGACGHELDQWESHVEHHPECQGPEYGAMACTCPEVCPACCRECS